MSELNEKVTVAKLDHDRRFDSAFWGPRKWAVAYWTPWEYRTMLFRSIKKARKFDRSRYRQDKISAFFRFKNGQWYRYKENDNEPGKIPDGTPKE